MENRESGPSKFQTDWSKCCLRQKKGWRSKALQAQQTQENGDYTMIVVNIPLFYTINEMLIVLDLARLDDIGGLGEFLRK